MQGFLDALKRQERAPVIAEIKRRDPAGQDLLGTRDPGRVAMEYDRHGAAALSVVTGRWFGGDAQLLADIVRAVPDLPVLRKDFLVTDSALQDSRDIGASAVLITVALMRPGQTARLIDSALALGLTPFVEIANEAEAELVPLDRPLVIAVNNSDIATRETQGEGPARSLALYQAVAARRAAAIVAASRIHDAATGASLIAAGFDALLMGTALMRRPALIAEIDELRRAAQAPFVTGVSPC